MYVSSELLAGQMWSRCSLSSTDLHSLTLLLVPWKFLRLCLTPWLQLRFDYGTTTIRLRRIVRGCFQFDAGKNEHVNFFVVVVSQSNHNYCNVGLKYEMWGKETTKSDETERVSIPASSGVSPNLFFEGGKFYLEANWDSLTHISCSTHTNVFRPTQTTVLYSAQVTVHVCISFI